MPDFSLKAECTTKETGIDGVRHGCTSDWDQITAPAGYVINRDTIKVNWSHQMGSENSYSIVYDDWVEILPGSGLKAPRTIKMRVRARGPKGPLSGRGQSKISISGDFAKYK